jgi:hypothetical protein
MLAGFLLAAADPSAAVAAVGAVRDEAPCRLVEAGKTEETFISCAGRSVRLAPGRRYERLWNAQLGQLLVVGRGERDDRVWLVSTSEKGVPLVEDLTVELVAVAEQAETGRTFQGLRFRDVGQFAAQGRLQVSGIEYDPPEGKAAAEWQFQLGNPGAPSGEASTQGRTADASTGAETATEAVSQRVAIIR